MPYQGEYANKTSHSDIIRNPDVNDFLSNCEYLTVPSEHEAEAMVKQFVTAPGTEGVEFPENVIAIDGSLHETSLDDRLPKPKPRWELHWAVMAKARQV